MRLMWFQFKKTFSAPMLYIVLAYLAIFGYLRVYTQTLPNSLSGVIAAGLSSGFLYLGLGCFTIAYLVQDHYKEATLALTKKHSAYALSRLTALALLSVLAVLVFSLLIAALGPIFLNSQMVIGNVVSLAVVLLFYTLVHLFFVFFIAFCMSLFKRVIYSLYALAALFFLPALHTYLGTSVRYYLFWPTFYYHPANSQRMMLLLSAMALIYCLIAMIFYRAANRK